MKEGMSSYNITGYITLMYVVQSLKARWTSLLLDGRNRGLVVNKAVRAYNREI